MTQRSWTTLDGSPWSVMHKPWIVKCLSSGPYNVVLDMHLHFVDGVISIRQSEMV